MASGCMWLGQIEDAFPLHTCPQREKAFWVPVNRKLRFSTDTNRKPAQEAGQYGFKADVQSLCNKSPNVVLSLILQSCLSQPRCFYSNKKNKSND